MERTRITKVLGIILIVLFSVNSSFVFEKKIEAKQPYFTLVAKTNTGLRSDYLNLLQQQLARIGINLEVIIQGWPTFIGELIAFRDFDVCYVALSGGGVDPDMTGVYNENGSLNLFGYHTDMDYNETLGTGLNEWYIEEGTRILPPNSQHRINHYWAWQQYLMDNILPCLPTFAPREYTVHWNNLKGYNASDGILQSWGKMSWDDTHTAQQSTNEVVITDGAWSDLNPLFQDDSSSNLISSAVLDSLIYFDDDNSVWPHLATNWTHLSDTHIRMTLRDGVKWQNDSDDLFPNEYFDVKDVYFTLETWRTISSDNSGTSWLDHMEIVDDYTIDFYIDGDPSTPEAEPSTNYLQFFASKMLPEHYLNQTQLPNGVTPDITHESWSTFAIDAFGTGLFTLAHFEEGEETILTINPDCWRLNSSLTSDPTLNWENRFGDFSESPTQLRVRIIPDNSIALAELRAGRVDIEGVTSDRNVRLELEDDTNFVVQSEATSFLGFFGFNMRSVRPVIGNPDSSEIDPSITKGLAVRKAISYAADLEEINDVVHAGEYTITHHPIFLKLGVWCNPNIIKYTHNLALAEEYMEKAGYGNPPGESNQVGINLYNSLSCIFVLLGVFVVIGKKRSRK